MEIGVEGREKFVVDIKSSVTGNMRHAKFFIDLKKEISEMSTVLLK